MLISYTGNYEIIKIETIIRRELLERFENAYQTLSHSNNQVVPIFAYHGTQASNIPSIQKVNNNKITNGKF